MSALTLPAPATADALVILAVLKRRESEARALRDRVAQHVTAELATGEPLDHDTEVWRHGTYTRWAEAWEALEEALTMLQVKS